MAGQLPLERTHSFFLFLGQNQPEQRRARLPALIATKRTSDNTTFLLLFSQDDLTCIGMELPSVPDVHQQARQVTFLDKDP